MNKGTLSGIQIQQLYDPANKTSTFSTDVANMKLYSHATIVVHLGTVGANDFTMTVLACDDNTPTTSTAMAFNYRTKAASTGTWGALTAATSSGLAITTSHSNYAIAIELDAIELEAVATNRNHVMLTFTDAASGDIYVSVIAILSEPKYPQYTAPSAID